MQQMSPRQLKDWLNDPARPKPLLLDVRQAWEYDICHIESSLPMPMSAIPARFMELDKGADIVVVCHHGARSMQVGMFLEQQGFSGITNLAGGVAAWARDVDPAMATY